MPKGGRRAAPVDAAEQAYRRFLSHQKAGLQQWAQKRASLLDEVGMSADMESLVFDLLEELSDEPAALAAPSEVHAGTEALLLRACRELRFVERHARQAIAIVLAREGASVSLVQRPGLLSDCLDWLCVHVPLDELPLKFRPKLRLRRAPQPALPRTAAAALASGASATGGAAVCSIRHSSAPAVRLEEEEEAPLPPWACAACTYLNADERSVCEMCDASRPPLTPLELAQREERRERIEAREAEREAARAALEVWRRA